MEDGSDARLQRVTTIISLLLGAMLIFQSVPLMMPSGHDSDRLFRNFPSSTHLLLGAEETIAVALFLFRRTAAIGAALLLLAFAIAAIVHLHNGLVPAGLIADALLVILIATVRASRHRPPEPREEEP